MSNTYFQFKKFTVHQKNAPFKVGTDACLLAAWTDIHNTNTCLEIGFGTGVISLMLAQRQVKEITAIEILPEAFTIGQNNIKNSPFSHIIQCIHDDFLKHSFNRQYDLIISNPPYFPNALKNKQKSIALSRHEETLTLKTLLQKSKQLLQPQGKIALILPIERLTDLKDYSDELQLYIKRITEVKPNVNKNTKRFLTELQLNPCEEKRDVLIIEKHAGEYSDEFKLLLKDFYLNL